MRAPAQNLAVDAAILIAAAAGRSAGVILEVGASRALISTDRALQEAHRRIELGMKRPDWLPGLGKLLLDIEIEPAANLGHLLTDAQHALREAVPSRNGSTNDAHLLALAWAFDADIWSADRDFAGTGIASWSTPNLLRALKRA